MKKFCSYELVANKRAPIDFNDVPLSTLIEKNSDAIDVNFILQNNFNNNAYRGNFNPRLFLVIPLITRVISAVIPLIITIETPLILRIILKNLSILKKFSMLQ